LTSDIRTFYNEKNNILLKREIILTKEIVVTHLLFSLQNDKLMKVIHNLNLCAIPTSKVSIDKQLYKVMNAVFYHDSSIDEGHYTSMCRERTSNIWIEANDAQVKKKQCPRGAKDVYLLFLQKIAK